MLLLDQLLGDTTDTLAISVFFMNANTLRKKSLIRIFPEFPRIRTKYSGENTGKIRARITPNTDTFYAVNIPL